MAPLLSAVSCEEDRGLVLDVLAAIKACRQPEQLCVSWSVSPAAGGYIITAYLPPPSSTRGATMEITHDDLGMIESVNLLRVRAGVAHLTQDSWGLKIRITSHKSPVSYTTYDTLRFSQRRFSLWGLGGGGGGSGGGGGGLGGGGRGAAGGAGSSGGRSTSSSLMGMIISGGGSGGGGGSSLPSSSSSSLSSSMMASMISSATATATTTNNNTTTGKRARDEI